MLSLRKVERPSGPESLTFILGQDRSGHWVVREAHGLSGGIFVSREAALKFVTAETDHRCDAVQFTAEPLEFRCDPLPGTPNCDPRFGMLRYARRR